jgi:hypothetical protein
MQYKNGFMAAKNPVNIISDSQTIGIVRNYVEANPDMGFVWGPDVNVNIQKEDGVVRRISYSFYREGLWVVIAGRGMTVINFYFDPRGKSVIGHKVVNSERRRI